jgi:hypothetical protein
MTQRNLADLLALAGACAIVAAVYVLYGGGAALLAAGTFALMTGVVLAVIQARETTDA